MGTAFAGLVAGSGGPHSKPVARSAPRVPEGAVLPQFTGLMASMLPAADVQRDLLDSLEAASRHWLDRRPMTTPEIDRLMASLATAAVDAPDPDVLIRMQADLKRALDKPMAERRWVMVIDLRKCVGCSACTIACVVENQLPPGVVYRPVIEQEIGTYPHVTRRFLPRPCMHCGNPPCTPVCPVAATWKREDGIVVVDYDACIGCRYCVTACPYNARTFDFGEYYTDTAQVAGGTEHTLGREAAGAYEHVPSFEYGKRWNRAQDRSPVGNVRKCHFCAHRLDAGMLPECVTTCIGRATYFGDRNDPESLVHELLGQPSSIRLKEELGTDPQVYYLV